MSLLGGLGLIPLHSCKEHQDLDVVAACSTPPRKALDQAC
jgi:hypothetical protein